MHGLISCPVKRNTGRTITERRAQMSEQVSNWFSNSSNALAFAQLAAAAVTAIATIALWRVTRVLADETAILAKMTSRPFVVCYLESSGASAVALNLTLRNTGTRTAFDIKLELFPALPKHDGSPSENEELSRREVSLLPPGQVLTIQGVMGMNIHDKVFSATVSWASLPGASIRETLSYKFEPTDGFRGGWKTKGPHDIANELEKLRKQLANRKQN
jgi:hypothetical protein